MGRRSPPPPLPPLLLHEGRRLQVLLYHHPGRKERRHFVFPHSFTQKKQTTKKQHNTFDCSTLPPDVLPEHGGLRHVVHEPVVLPPGVAGHEVLHLPAVTQTVQKLRDIGFPTSPWQKSAFFFFNLLRSDLTLHQGTVVQKLVCGTFFFPRKREEGGGGGLFSYRDTRMAISPPPPSSSSSFIAFRTHTHTHTHVGTVK